MLFSGGKKFHGSNSPSLFSREFSSSSLGCPMQIPRTPDDHRDPSSNRKSHGLPSIPSCFLAFSSSRDCLSSNFSVTSGSGRSFSLLSSSFRLFSLQERDSLFFHGSPSARMGSASEVLPAGAWPLSSVMRSSLRQSPVLAKSKTRSSGS